jgi:DNA-3-methyladenine glycosylase I
LIIFSPICMVSSSLCYNRYSNIIFIYLSLQFERLKKKSKGFITRGKILEQKIARCAWVTKGHALYESYHDNEWGVPVYEDTKHFELLVLESAQAGLSFRTILEKREGYRVAFANFDPKIVASFDEKKVLELMLFPGIIRNKKKIQAAIVNAQKFCDVQKEHGSFNSYVWAFVQGRPIRNQWDTYAQIPKETPESKALYTDLKKRGFSFLGKITTYAYMQAAGLVFDHTTDCFCCRK